MDIQDEIHRLDRLISLHPADELLYVERGKLHWKQQDLPGCLADYDEAVRLNPQSQAIHLKEMVMRIMSFYNKDMYNP